nr:MULTISPECIES: tetratricopeptide repeat protein [unclassified Neptuniibacter]
MVFQKVLSLAPSNFDANHFLGILCIRKRSYEDAIQYLVAAIQAKPKSGDAFHHLACALLELKRTEAALENFQIAVTLKPELAASYRGMGDIYSATGNVTAAIKNYKLSLKYDKNSVKSYNNLGHVYKTISELMLAVKFFKKAYELDSSRLDIFSNILMCVAMSEKANELYEHEAASYGAAAAKKAKKFQEWPNLNLNPKKRLRVGFVSGDFRSHVVTKLTAAFFEQLSHLDVELIAYHNNWTKDDAMTTALKSVFSEWYPVNFLDDLALAKKIHTDSIDILVDMSGHSAHNRLPVFAYKPAPIQVSWLGFFASSGLAEMDYFIADKVGAETTSSLYVEELWTVDSFQCLAMGGIDIDRCFSYLPSEDSNVFTFGCMNRIDKVSDSVIDVWTNILAKCPQSQLYLNSSLFKDDEFKQSFLNRFLSKGIESDRLLLEYHDGTYQGYLSSFKKIDLVLDTFPYTGSTVNMESLWMGVPYVSLLGDTIIGRTGSSILKGVNLSELIASDEQEYIDTAVNYAKDPSKLKNTKMILHESIKTSGFFNPSLIAEDFMQAFEQMWQRYVGAK